MTLNLRDSDTRDAQARDKHKRKHWNPPAQLAVPEGLFESQGYIPRWIRHEIKGAEDSKNVVTKLREGYEPVRPEELPDDYITDVLPAGRYQGTVRVGDLMLVKIPIETVEEKRAYVEQRTERLQDSIDASLMANQNPSMPITKESKSSVTKGRPDFQED